MTHEAADEDSPTLHEESTIGASGCKGEDRLALLCAFCETDAESLAFPHTIASAKIEVLEAVLSDESVVTSLSARNVDQAVCLIITDGKSYGVVAIDEIPVYKRIVH